MNKILCTITLAILCCMATLPAIATNDTSISVLSPPLDEFEITLIKFRLERMDCPVRAGYNPDVASYLRMYLTYGKRDTETVLGNGALYFPIFEHYLELYGLPRQLKYLPIVESSMKPYAVSYAGATGLWQFTYATGKHMGLAIDRYMDERMDPYRSSEAAVKYLKKMFDQFGTWELALAAYNCGPGRLGKIIEAYGSKDFAAIKSGLPVETQQYLDRFVAACYVGTYHHLHGILPKLPEVYCLQPVVGRVFSAISFKNISAKTGVEINTLRDMNPSFKQDYSPARERGIFLVLPKNSWADYLKTEGKGDGKKEGVRP